MTVSDTLRDTLSAAEAVLAEAGVASPRFDAEELLAHALGTTRSRLPLHAAIGPAQLRRFQALIDERADRVPLQHLTGVAGFRYLALAVGPGVFIPRPETELLAGWAIDALRTMDSPIVVDLCAGSGAIALSIAHEVPAATVYAVELDPMAVAWARRNADQCAANGDRPITLLAADVTDPDLMIELTGRVDAVLANPPYVPDGASIDREVAEHDPPLALWGGPDGLDVVRRMLVTAARLLAPGGVLAVEHADLQGAALPAVIRAQGGFCEITDHRDLAGRPRFSTARRDNESS